MMSSAEKALVGSERAIIGRHLAIFRSLAFMLSETKFVLFLSLLCFCFCFLDGKLLEGCRVININIITTRLLNAVFLLWG